MKIISWNCNGKFREKFKVISKESDDLYIIQECENPNQSENFEYKNFAKNCLWIGDIEYKGLGIFSKENIKLTKNDWKTYCLKNFISVNVNNEFDLVGVWACERYIEEYYLYQNINMEKYNDNTIIIGDFSGEKGRIQTQYQNLVEDDDVFMKGFYVPENVYIIGTMNDIDRSVDTMDFAFRRRFTFYEVKAEDTIEMLDEKTDENGNITGLPPKITNVAKTRITNLNNAISKIDGLNSSHHIGGAYFLKLNELDGDFEQLWKYHLEGLLREYLRGHDDAETKLSELKEAYDSEDSRSKPENDTNSANHFE